MIRKAEKSDLPGMLRLYSALYNKPEEAMTETLKRAWDAVLSDPRQAVLVAEENGTLVSTCVCVIVPNLSRGGSPYALIENVVTLPEYRGKGWAGKCMAAVKQLARDAGCYKIMLLTGKKEETIWRFYENQGYNRQDKTGFIQWL